MLMKNYMKAFVIVLAFLSINFIASAQKPKTGCNDAAIKAKADGLKEQYKKQNMVVFQEAMIQMVSMEPAPVAVKLTQGKLYHLIFVASQEANRLTLEIFDGKDKKIDEKTVKGADDYIVYSFIPSKTDVYLMMLTQRKGAKNLCGSFTVMMPDPRPKTVAKQEEPKQEQAAETPAAKSPTKAQPINNPRYRPNAIKKTAAQPAKH
jgi:hypothetical protein